MKLSTFLQLFLLIDVFFMGVLAALAVRHGRAHLRPHQGAPAQSAAPVSAAVQVPAAVKTRMIEAAEGNFQTTLAQTASGLAQDLGATTDRINELLNKLGTEVIGNELEQYRAELTRLRQEATASLQGVSQAVAQHETALKAQLAQEVAAEKQRLISQIDTRLSDAVASFLLETLGHNVDLGAQAPYLTAMLSEHKQELIEGIQSDTT